MLFLRKVVQEVVTSFGRAEDIIVSLGGWWSPVLSCLCCANDDGLRLGCWMSESKQAGTGKSEQTKRWTGEGARDAVWEKWRPSLENM